MGAPRILDLVYASLTDPHLGVVNVKALLVDSVGSVATIAGEAQPLLVGLNSQEVVQVGASNICFIKVSAVDFFAYEAS